MSGDATTFRDSDEKTTIVKPLDIASRSAAAGVLAYGMSYPMQTYVTPSMFALWAAIGTAAGTVARGAVVSAEGDTNQLNMGQLAEYGGAGVVSAVGSGHPASAGITFIASAASRGALNIAKRFMNVINFDVFY